MSYKSNETNKGKTWSKEEKDDLLKELLEKKITELSKEILSLQTILINIEDNMTFHEEEIARLKGKPTMSPEPEL